MGELEIPIGVKGTDSSELETVTVSADALMKGQDIEIAGLKSVLDCVRGG